MSPARDYGRHQTGYITLGYSTPLEIFHTSNADSMQDITRRYFHILQHSFTPRLCGLSLEQTRLSSSLTFTL